MRPRRIGCSQRIQNALPSKSTPDLTGRRINRLVRSRVPSDGCRLWIRVSVTPMSPNALSSPFTASLRLAFSEPSLRSPEPRPFFIRLRRAAHKSPTKTEFANRNSPASPPKRKGGGGFASMRTWVLCEREKVPCSFGSWVSRDGWISRFTGRL
jgi:hypothetical protein